MISITGGSPVASTELSVQNSPATNRWSSVASADHRDRAIAGTPGTRVGCIAAGTRQGRYQQRVCSPRNHHVLDVAPSRGVTEVGRAGDHDRVVRERIDEHELVMYVTHL